jgi:Raf kinase inhibitor-like YbhB/YbcL family protein
MTGRTIFALTGAAAMLIAAPLAASAAPFNVTSTSWKDNDPIPAKYAGAHPGRECGGQNVSPQLSWSDAPEKTKSFAIVMFDPEGGNGLGSIHWVAYGIPATKTSFAEGEASNPPKDYVGGKNNVGTDHYFGPCGPAEHALHHYIITVIATDLATDALKPGLTREELLTQLKGHALAPGSLVGRYVKPK